jgi:hypothetical protein
MENNSLNTCFLLDFNFIIFSYSSFWNLTETGYYCDEWESIKSHRPQHTGKILEFPTRIEIREKKTNEKQ